MKVLRPYDQSLISEIGLDAADIVMHALNKAHLLFQDRSRWLAPHQRIAILERAAVLMQERADSLVTTALQEGGKPCRDTKVEVEVVIEFLKKTSLRKINE